MELYPVGLSTCGKVISEKLFAEFMSAGITEAEISTDLEAYDHLDFDAIRRDALSTGLHLNSFHLPFSSPDRLDISSLNGEQRGRNLAYLSEFIRKAGGIGIGKIVIHPSSEPIPDAERGERMRISKESLCLLQRTALEAGSCLCVEDLPRSCLGHTSPEMLDLLSADESLTCCFDTNHLLTEDAAQFVRALGKKIVTLHVSDFDFMNERHWLPGEGKLDFARVIEALREVGYAGAWLYEINYACPRTILRPRDLTAEDFARNARELFHGLTPTVISTHKEKLGMWE